MRTCGAPAVRGPASSSARVPGARCGICRAMELLPWLCLVLRPAGMLSSWSAQQGATLSAPAERRVQQSAAEDQPKEQGVGQPDHEGHYPLPG